MATTKQSRTTREWDTICALASRQLGYFTSHQLDRFSSSLLQEHIRAGRIERSWQRGVYRLAHVPACEHEELVPVWLWSDATGVVSHESALALHGLSDALPARLHLTLPVAKRRRLRTPPDVVLHYAEVPLTERSWFGIVPATSPARSLQDCARTGFQPDLLRQAARQALQRGLVAPNDLAQVKKALAPFDGALNRGVHFFALLVVAWRMNGIENAERVKGRIPRGVSVVAKGLRWWVATDAVRRANGRARDKVHLRPHAPKRALSSYLILRAYVGPVAQSARLWRLRKMR